jgi:hypothetical protein
MKTLLRTTLIVCLVLGFAGAAQAKDLGMEMYFKGTMNMYAPDGTEVMADPAVTGTMVVDMFTMGGTGTMQSPNPFFGYVWTVSDIQFSMHMLDMSVDMKCLMHWAGNEIPVRMTMQMGLNLLKTSWVVMKTLDADKDGVPGTAMSAAAGQFEGFSPTMTGLAKVTKMLTWVDRITNPKLTHD